MSASSHELELGEAVPLAHALVAQAARDHDVRTLFIKGPTAELQGLRDPRTSLDVDVLVDPARRHVLADALGDLGWVDDRPYTSPTLLPHHSLTYRHPFWPCELDLHDRFPGFFGDPQDVFERLWNTRSTVEVAGQTIPCPDRTGQILVLALHALRDPHDSVHAVELTSLVNRVRGFEDPDTLRDLSELAAALGAADTAAPFLVRVDARVVGGGSTGPGDLKAWQQRTSPDASIVGWVAEWRRLPWRRRPRFLWYAAFLTEDELRLDSPGMPPGRAALARARLVRLRRGLRAVPGAWRRSR